MRQLHACLTLAILALNCGHLPKTDSDAERSDDTVPSPSSPPPNTPPPPFKPHTDLPDCEHVAVEKDCNDGFCRIPAGCFVMGPALGEYGAPSDEFPVSVTLTRSFEIMQTELTRAQFAALGFDEPHDRRRGASTPCLEAQCPIGDLSWYSALLVANRISQAHDLPPCYRLEGCSCYGGVSCEVGDTQVCDVALELNDNPYTCTGFRLPTEAEWEYAARAGTQTAFYNGDITPHEGLLESCRFDTNLDRVAWYCKNSKGPQPVAQKAPNPWGLFDILGNVEEFTSSPFAQLPRAPVTDPHQRWPQEPMKHVVARGGDVTTWPAATRTSWRYGMGTDGTTFRGLRLVRTLP
jgi:sulfatase modifying factor 1